MSSEASDVKPYVGQVVSICKGGSRANSRYFFLAASIISVGGPFDMIIGRIRWSSITAIPRMKRAVDACCVEVHDAISIQPRLSQISQNAHRAHQQPRVEPQRSTISKQSDVSVRLSSGRPANVVANPCLPRSAGRCLNACEYPGPSGAALNQQELQKPLWQGETPGALSVRCVVHEAHPRLVRKQGKWPAKTGVQFIMRGLLPAILLGILTLSSCTKKEASDAPKPGAEASVAVQPPAGPHAFIHLRDGSQVAGSIVASSRVQMAVAGDDGIERKIPTAQIQSVEYGDVQPSQTARRAARERARPKPPIKERSEAAPQPVAEADRSQPSSVTPSALPPLPAPAVTTKT